MRQIQEFWARLSSQATEGSTALLEKPSSRRNGRHGAESGGKSRQIDPRRARVVRFKDDLAGLVSTWASLGDATSLGASASPLTAEEIRTWNDGTACVAFILEYDGDPVGFCNVAILDRAADLLEIGRLLVKPEMRNRSLGSILLRHVSLSLHAVMEDQREFSVRVFARVLPDNIAAQQLMKCLPFRESRCPVTVAGAAAYAWFEYAIRLRDPCNFGRRVRAAREKLGMSQAQLAFMCGVHRVTMNMVESGRRNPSIELLQALTEVLSTNLQGESGDPGVKTQLMLACVGQELPTAVLAREPVARSRADDDQSNDLWIVSDEFAELLIPEYLSATLRAIQGGCSRWYFMPEFSWLSRGQLLISQLEEGTSKEVVRQRVRMYSLPSYVCHLRIAIRNPTPSGCESSTVQGEGRARVLLDRSRADDLCGALNACVVRLEYQIRIAGENCIEGMSRIYPSVESLSANAER